MPVFGAVHENSGFVGQEDLFQDSANSARIRVAAADLVKKHPKERGIFLTRRGKRHPSDRLCALLNEQGLGVGAQWRECEPIVRELAGDLPDFDSVWLDAMVQRGLLTGWQSEQLQQEPSGRLRVGSWQLREALGDRTFLAYNGLSRCQEVLRQLPLEVAAGDESGRRSRLVEQLSGLVDAVTRSGARPPRSVLLPSIAEVEAESLWLAEPWIPGWDLEELLVRGGRLPWEAVGEVGRELLQGLSWFESGGWIHGDLVLRNIRLTPSGRIVLADAFSRRLSQPRPSVGGPLSLESSEGLAPELLGTYRPADVRSEMHALGCVLWQLLTARCPVAAADPVRRLLKLRDFDVPDVRELVPDCPEWMARSLQSMTRRLPELRPPRTAELAVLWGRGVGAGFGALRRIAGQMPDRRQRHAASRVRRIPAPRRFVGVGRLMLGAAAAAVLMFAAMRPELLPLPLALKRTPFLGDGAAEGTAAVSAVERLRVEAAAPIPLPEPDASGRILLQPGQRYLSAPRRRRGELRIETSGGANAVILVSAGRPWTLQADSVILRNLQLQRSTGSDEAAAAPPAQQSSQLVAVQSRELTVEGCIVQSPSDADDFSGVAWYEPAGERGRISIHRSVFAGGGYGFAMNHPPQELELDQVLLASRGGGLLCELSDPERPTFAAKLRRVTMRFGFSVADLVVHEGGPARLEAILDGGDSAFSPRMALVRVRPAAGWTSAEMLVRFTSDSPGGGNPVVVSPELEPAVYIDRSLGQPVALPDSQVPDPQLLFAELQFRGSGSGEGQDPWLGAEVLDFEGPKLSAVMPGCRSAELPRPCGGEDLLGVR